MNSKNPIRISLAFSLIILSYIVISPIVMQGLSACLVGASQLQSGYDGVSLPSFPQAGNPATNLTDVPFKVNVVFVGFPPNSIDTSEIYKELPTNYTTINRMVYGDVKKMVKYSSFRISYTFSGFETAWQTFANKFADYIESHHKVDYAPYWLQEGVQYSGITTNPVEQCWYVDAREAELWIKNNAPAGSFQDGYTILIMDTWHTTPKITNYYFYNGSVPSVPLPIDPSARDSQFMIGYGGYYRFLFVDLQAGPSTYMDTGNVKPLWLYSLPDQAKELSRDIGKTVKNTVELRFLPSFLYAPTYRPSYWVDVTIFNKDPTLPILFDMDRLLQEYRDFQPYSQFEGASQVTQIQSDASLFQAVESATDVDGITNPNLVADYFLTNLGEYAGQHGNDYVLSVFILAGYDFGGLLGRSCSDGNGNPAFVIECLNRKMGGFDLVSEPWGVVDQPYSLSSGWFVHFIDPVMLDKNTMLTFGFNLLQGSVNVRVTDVYNFNKWKDSGYDYAQAFFHETWSLTAGSHELEFIPPDPGGEYYIIIENSGFTTATFYGLVVTSRIEGFTLTPLTVHETGHSLGLAHPHDGFSWILYQQGLPVESPGEYVNWLWDFSTTPMTYAACNMRFDQLDRDSVYRGTTATLLNETFTMLRDTEDKLNQLGFGAVPPNVLGNASTAISKTSEALTAYSGTNPDYATSVQKALEAHQAATNAFNEIEATLYSVSLTVKDLLGLAIQGATVSMTLPNATVLNTVTDSRGIATFNGIPYGDYTATVSSSGQTAQVQFNSEQAAESPPQVTIPFSMTVTLVIVGLVIVAVAVTATVLVRRRMKQRIPQPPPP